MGSRSLPPRDLSAPETVRWPDEPRVRREFGDRQAVWGDRSWLLRLRVLGSVNLIEDGSATAGKQLLRGLRAQLLRICAIARFTQQQFAIGTGYNRFQVQSATLPFCIRPDRHLASPAETGKQGSLACGLGASSRVVEPGESLAHTAVSCA